MEVILTGQHRLGTWSDHLKVWRPWERPNTLLIKYEELVGSSPGVLEQLGNLFERDILSTDIPGRSSLADGQWIRKTSDWRLRFTIDDQKLFDKTNEEMMCKMGYYR